MKCQKAHLQKGLEMLAKLNVKCVQKDKNEKEIIEWREILVNEAAIASCIEVPETNTALIKLLNGDQFLFKGINSDILKAFINDHI